MSRRGALRGAGLGAVGLAGAALIGCSDDDGDGDATPTGTISPGDIGGTSTPVPTASASDTPVPADQVRIEPGIYEGSIPPSAAELNPALNHKRGGTVLARYLNPPRMDLNRVLSCTVFHTKDYTNSKLVRARTGATASPYNVELEPDLAESWEVQENSTRIVYNLREGVMTHDKEPANGREFTSADVKASFDLYSAGGTQKDVYSNVLSYETPDDYTFIVNLETPQSDFVGAQSSWSFIELQEIVEDEDLRQEIAIGTGPFVQDEWVPKETSKFSAHPNYFGVDALGNQLPYIDGIETFVLDTASRRAAFATDNLMVWGARDDADAADMLKQRGDTFALVKFPQSRGANTNGFQFQMNNPTFQDDRVRRAMSLAFDRDEYDLARNAGDQANPDGGAYSNSPMPWSLLFDEYPSRQANGPWYQHDPAEASKMMQAAGYTPDAPLEMEMVSFYYRRELAELIAPGIQQNLPEVNINFREVDNATHVTLMADRNFEDTMGILWGPPGYVMDQWIYPFYHSNAGNNFGSINDPELDALLDKQREVTEGDEQKQVWMDIYNRIHDQVYQAWFPQPFLRYGHHNYLMNVRGHGLMGSYVCYTSGQAREVWLDDGAPGVDR